MRSKCGYLRRRDSSTKHLGDTFFSIQDVDKINSQQSRMLIAAMGAPNKNIVYRHTPACSVRDRFSAIHNLSVPVKTGTSRETWHRGFLLLPGLLEQSVWNRVMFNVFEHSEAVEWLERLNTPFLFSLQDLLHPIHDGGLDLIQAVHHLFYAGSIDRVDLELRLFRLGQKLRIFQRTDEGFL